MKIELNEELLELNKQFKKLGVKLYVVGGYVRDFLLGKVSTDIDICSSMTPQEIVEKIKGFDLNVFNKKLGSTHISKNGRMFEHTTFRVDYYHDDGSHSPYEVEFSDSAYVDSYRRDFSMNCIYYDIQEDEIVDFYNGVADIKNRQVKAIVSPDYVFGSDGTRLLRMVRQACELDFDIENETFETAKSYIYQLKDISAKRIYDELIRILQNENFYTGLNNLSKLKAFEYIFKNIDLLPIKEKINKLLTKNKFYFLTKDTPTELRIKLLLVDIINICYKNCYDDQATLEGFCDYIMMSENFGISNKLKNEITDLVLFLDEYKNIQEDNEKKALILDNINCLDTVLFISQKKEEYMDILDLYNRLTKKNIALKLSKFCIKSDDVIKLGLKGKHISEALNDIFLYSVIYEISEKEILIKVLERLIKEGKYE
ncbi:MAG: CCA tRNA nucleotidyltransferase [Clostridia bacterium]|nr:CCA tRNA nucleotidyltransferase [Clostridia bacterium]